MITKMIRNTIVLFLAAGLTFSAARAAAEGTVQEEEVFDVTFNVDMSDADFDPDVYDVFITGSMVDWTEPGENPDFAMEPHADDSDIYTITLELEADDYEYKYFLVEDEPTWDNDEWPGDPDRSISVTDDKVVEDIFGVQPGETSADEILADRPEDVTLNQNYPNPFNPTTQISFRVPENAGQVTLTVYNTLGQEVAELVNEQLGAGTHTVDFDAAGLTSGTYIYRLNAAGMELNRTMTLVK